MDGYLGWLNEGGEIVTATHRLARHIRRDFDLAMVRSGAVSWAGASVVPWDAWLRQQWQHSLRSSGGAAGTRMLDQLQTELLWRDIVGRSGYLDPYVGVKAVARQAASAFAQVNRFGVPLEALTSRARSGDHRAFAAWATTYRGRCESEGYCDPYGLARFVGNELAASRLDLRGLVGFAGFEAARPDVDQLIGQLNAHGIQARRLNPEAVEPACEIRSSVTSVDELTAAATWARQLYIENPDARIAVVIPNLAERAEEVRRVFQDVLQPGWRLAESAQPFDVSFGSPLGTTGVVQAALLLIQMVSGRMGYREAGQLLRSPYLPGWPSEASARCELDLELRRRLGRIVSSHGICHLSGAPPVLSQCLSTIREFEIPDLATPAEWRLKFGELLEQVGWPGDGNFTERDRQALRAWLECLDQFATLDAFAGPVALRDAGELLNLILEKRLIQEPGPGAGPQVMGLLEATGIQFDHVWVAGMNADSWPGPRQPEPFISLDVRRRFGFPEATPTDSLGAARATLKALVHGAPDVVLSWFRQQDEEMLLPTPLLDDYQSRSNAAGQAPLNEHTVLYDHCLLGSAAMASMGVDTPGRLADTQRLRGGARLIGLQAECPARAFFEYRLGAKEIEKPALVLDARLRGVVTHDVMQQLFEPWLGKVWPGALPGQALALKIEQLAMAALRRRIPALDQWQQQILRVEARRQVAVIGQLLALENQRPPFTVAKIEAPMNFRLGGLTVKLRFDRVDVLKCGAELVIDYKTGKVSPGRWSGQRPREPQLPMYALAADADAIAYFRIDEGNVSIVGVGAEDFGIPGIKPVTAGTKNTVPDWDTQLQVWRRDLEDLAEEFVGGDVRLPGAASARGRADGQYAPLTRLYDSLVESPPANGQPRD